MLAHDLSRPTYLGNVLQLLNDEVQRAAGVAHAAQQVHLSNTETSTEHFSCD